MKTIAQQLGINEFPFEIKDKNEKRIYYENSIGFWYKREYDSNGNQIYYEDGDGFWWKSEFNSNGNQIYHERSNGVIVDKRPKPVIELTLDQIAEKMGIDVSQIRIKD